MDMADMNFDIKPTDDYVFKRLFGDDENKRFLIALLNAIFAEYKFLPKVYDLKYENNDLSILPTPVQLSFYENLRTTHGHPQIIDILD